MDIDGADLEDGAVASGAWVVPLQAFPAVGANGVSLVPLGSRLGPPEEPVSSSTERVARMPNDAATSPPRLATGPPALPVQAKAVSAEMGESASGKPAFEAVEEKKGKNVSTVEVIDVETLPPPAKEVSPPKKPASDEIPTDVHEILVRAKEMRLPTAKKAARKLHESRATGERPIDVALAEARIITQNVYVQRKPRTLEEDEIPVCSCKRPELDDQWGCLEDCVNRAALIECHPDYCPCGNRCDNQRIQRGAMPIAEVIDAGKKGLGIATKQFIKQGEFVAEYMGEIVTEQEYHLRRLRYHNEKHRYMMVLSGGEVIDATRMGGLARFINHSCDPNCGVEKWEVNGEERCAIFALRDINPGEELSFDYKFQSFSVLEITTCLCGAANCRGYIGTNNSTGKQPRKSNASHTALPGERSKRVDPITKKGTSHRKILEQALERIYRALAGHRVFTRKEVAMLLDSKLLLKRNLLKNVDENMRFLALEPYFVSENDVIFETDMQPVFAVRDLPQFPPKPKVESRTSKQERLELLVEKLRTISAPSASSQ